VEMTQRDKRAVIILGAIAVLAVVLFMFVLHKGGGEGSTPASASGGGAPPGGQSATSPSPHRTQAPSHPVFGGRDPFQPLVSAGGGESPSPEPSTSPQTSPSPSPSPSPSTSPSPGGGGGGGASINHGGHKVTLNDIFEKNGQQMAQVEIDGTVYTVKVGQTIAFDFKLVEIHDTCADFTHVTHPFTLCLNPQK
jgi:hypothetical protein